MNKFFVLMGLVAAIAISGFSTSHAQTQGVRQYYGNWSSHSSGKYSYRAYYYKPTPNYVGFKHHYVIHVESRPKHNYYYNPYTKKYWGRCPASYGTNPTYSILAEADRHGDLSKIEESKFAEPSPTLPPIPESNDKVSLDLPPDDLPDLSSIPVVKE